MAKKKTDKKYKYVTRTLTLPDGTRKYVYGKTRAEAEAKLAKLKAEVAQGVDVNDQTTFGELAKLWIDKYKAPFVRPATVWGLRTAINAHLMPALSTQPVKSITPYQIQSIVAEAVSDGYQGVGLLLNCLRGIFDVAVELGCISKSPVPASLRPPKPEHKAEKQIIPDAVDEHLLNNLKPLSAERLFYLLGRQEGMRRGEILAMNWENIDLERGIIRVRKTLAVGDDGKTYWQGVTKTEDGMRDLPITPDVHDELARWRDWYGVARAPLSRGIAQSGGYLFVRPSGECHTQSSAARLWERIRREAANADESFAKDFTSHTMRHTYITRLFEAGLDIKEIQALAGHKDVRTTLSTYTHYDKAERQAKTFDAVRAIFGGEEQRAEEGKSDQLWTEEGRAGNVVEFPRVAVNR